MTATVAALNRSGCLRRVDVALADWIARAFPDTPADLVLAAALAARAVADGHSALDLDQAQAWLDGLAQGKAPTLPPVAAWCEALRNAPAVCAHREDASATPTPLVFDAQARVYLRRYFEYERRLAQALIARVDSSPLPQTASSFGGEGWVRGQNDGSIGDPVTGNMPDATRPVGSFADRSVDAARQSGKDLDPEQQSAIDTALARRFTLITGGPGTGKTHSVVCILAALAAQAAAVDKTLHIALAAPTGKAAARLRESIRAQRAQLALPDAIGAQLPDEASTVHRLIGLSPWRAEPRHHAGNPLPFDLVVVDEVSMVDLPLMTRLADAVRPDARLILLGDPNQLAAVEAGNVLGALVDAAGDGPLHECHVTLIRGHRFASGSDLAGVTAAIADGDAEAALRALDQRRDATLVDGTVGMLDAATDAYRKVAEAPDPAAALQAARDFRVLTALRHGPSGCIAIDAAIAGRLQRACGTRADQQWWRGRLVMVTGNRPELGLFNGDIGVAWPEPDGGFKVWFEDSDDTPRAFAAAALPPHEGAFALTVHKAQGSEFERVALVTGPESPVLTRELLYTGVTRARSTLTLYSTREVLRAGIGRRTLRFTGLADRLREAAQTTGT